MEIYLIRHTTPAVEKGICYGQSDLDVVASFAEEAQAISHFIPADIQKVYASPLKRCSLLAEFLFEGKPIHFHNELKEIHCGDWELQHWDAIPKEALDPFMNNFVEVPMPGGESYLHLFARVNNIFNEIQAQKQKIAVVSHGGVIRSILSAITQTPLKDSFNAFQLYYGCVVRLIPQQNGSFAYEVLHNVKPQQAEQHKPSK
ncbi:MAG: alpha-ribazole phosphatase family protein [Chitinophagaceae bacterium]